MNAPVTRAMSSSCRRYSGQSNKIRIAAEVTASRFPIAVAPPVFIRPNGMVSGWAVARALIRPAHPFTSREASSAGRGFLGFRRLFQVGLHLPYGGRVPLALIADVFQTVGIGQKILPDLDCYRLCQRLRIVHCDLQVHVPEIDPRKTLLKADFFAVQVAARQTLFVVVAVRVDNQRVAVPMTGRIAEP